MTLFPRFRQRILTHTGTLVLLFVAIAAQAAGLEDADRLFRQGQYGQALEKTNTYLADKPKDAQARFLKGLILTEQGKIADAVKMFSGLAEDYPDLPEPHNNLAVLYASQGQYDKARQSLEMAIRTHPSYATAHENLGDIYAKMASEAYDRALQLDKNNAGTQTKLAMIRELFAGNARKSEPAPADSTAPAATTKEQAVPAQPAPAASAPPAAKSAPAPAAIAPGDDTAQTIGAILKAVDDWAAAWSAQNVDLYLSFYADDFRTPGGEALEAWKAARRERLTTPKSIHVEVGKPNVTLTGNDRATVKFRQSYRANHLSANGNKTLLLIKAGGKWLIQEERSK